MGRVKNVVDEEFQKIVLEELRDLREGQKNLVEGQKSLVEEQRRLGERQENLERRVDENSIAIRGMKEEHGVLLRGIEEKLKIQQKSVEKIDFIEEAVKEIKKDINKVEQVTADNWSDIAKLKSFKVMETYKKGETD